MRRYVAVAVLLALAISGAPVSAAPPAAPAVARPAPSAAERRAALAELGARLAHRLPQARPPLAAKDHEFDEGSRTTYRAGDLDGDGSEELVAVRSEYAALGFVASTVMYVHRGRDGALLWSSDLGESMFVFPVFTKVGPNGTPGLVVVAYDVSGFGIGVYPVVARTRVVSYDAKGATLWSASYADGGAYTSAYVAGAYAGAVTYVDGLLDAVPGGGTDVLVTTQHVAAAGTLVAYTGGNVTEPTIIDGATGKARSLNRLVSTSSPDTYTAAAGDLDGDRRDDVVAATGGSPATVTALRSSDGSVLWTSKALPRAGVAWPQSVPDATGDRVADLVVTTAWGPPPTGAGGEEPHVSLLDGRTGAARWKQPGEHVATLGGDADGRPGAEVVVASRVYKPGTTGMRMAAFGATGRRLWAAVRTVPTGGQSGYVVRDYAVEGDTNADGVRDVAYRFVFQRFRESDGEPVGTAARNEGVLDGRTGRARRAPAPDMRMLPLAFDGRGSDALTMKAARGRTTVTAWRGDAAQRLWEATFDTPSTPPHVQGTLFADRDRCADLVLGVSDGRATTDYVLSGATGRPLWSITHTSGLGGGGTKITRRPALRAHRQHARTCRSG